MIAERKKITQGSFGPSAFGNKEALLKKEKHEVLKVNL